MEPELMIVYNEEQADGNYEVMVMDMDGGNPMNISNSPGVDWANHSYGDRVYFLSDRDTVKRHYFLHYTDDLGETIHKLYDVRLYDSWYDTRKEGNELIVNPHSSVDSAFHIINLKGELIARIPHPYKYSNDPGFSPDGTQIVFSGSPRRSKGTATLHEELFVMNDDGTDLRQLTVYPDGDTTAMWFEYHAGQPIWEPNSNRISYVSKQNGSHSIYSVHPQSIDNLIVTEGAFDQGWHNWSPDGSMLVFDGADTTDAPNYDIYLMNMISGEVDRLTFDTLYQQAPHFVSAPKKAL